MVCVLERGAAVVHLEGDVMQEVIGAEGCSGLGGDAGRVSISTFFLVVWESLIGCM